MKIASEAQPLFNVSKRQSVLPTTNTNKFIDKKQRERGVWEAIHYALVKC